MGRSLSTQDVRDFLSAPEDADIHRIHYCYQIGSTFVHLALMENSILQAMSVCDRIKVTNLLGSDASNWNQLISKVNKLQKSTLGGLIAILSKHGVARSDLDYLNWVKARRNFFVHHFFYQANWPGDLDDDEINVLCRRLRYLEIVFSRASNRIWRIFGRANLMHYQDLGENGVLMTNLDLLQPDGSTAVSIGGDNVSLS